MERKLFEDNELIHAVINSDFDKVKELVKTKYPKPIYDIGGFEKQCPIFIISLCLNMCFAEFPDKQIFKERSINNAKILDLFVSQFNLGNIEDLMIEDYTGPCFDSEEDRVAEWKEESARFDFSRSLESLLYDEITDKKRYSVIKKLCELGADPFDESYDGEGLICYAGDDIQMGSQFIESILSKNKDKYTIDDVAEIIAFGSNLQNYNIMETYSNS